ncbi:hypothetical protein PAPYR_6066 [Paratrimastix pyriformis]|uniref:Uncharacterized protein n=1 Tax=Paratrimastix pyriformis TaxID=342808 RepID=A0ABQ8UG57_9EUKA|nr:hypothetical protein PAPYR_6066 [Paratrimastix pyriformis]
MDPLKITPPPALLLARVGLSTVSRYSDLILQAQRARAAQSDEAFLAELGFGSEARPSAHQPTHQPTPMSTIIIPSKTSPITGLAFLVCFWGDVFGRQSGRVAAAGSSLMCSALITAGNVLDPSRFDALLEQAQQTWEGPGWVGIVPGQLGLDVIYGLWKLSTTLPLRAAATPQDLLCVRMLMESLVQALASSPKTLFQLHAHALGLSLSAPFQSTPIVASFSVAVIKRLLDAGHLRLALHALLQAERWIQRHQAAGPAAKFVLPPAVLLGMSAAAPKTVRQSVVVTAERTTCPEASRARLLTGRLFPAPRPPALRAHPRSRRPPPTPLPPLPPPAPEGGALPTRAAPLNVPFAYTAASITRPPRPGAHAAGVPAAPGVGSAAQPPATSPAWRRHATEFVMASLRATAAAGPTPEMIRAGSGLNSGGQKSRALLEGHRRAMEGRRHAALVAYKQSLPYGAPALHSLLLTTGQLTAAQDLAQTTLGHMLALVDALANPPVPAPPARPPTTPPPQPASPPASPPPVLRPRAVSLGGPAGAAGVQLAPLFRPPAAGPPLVPLAAWSRSPVTRPPSHEELSKLRREMDPQPEAVPSEDQPPVDLQAIDIKLEVPPPSSPDEGSCSDSNSSNSHAVSGPSEDESDSAEAPPRGVGDVALTPPHHAGHVDPTPAADSKSPDITAAAAAAKLATAAGVADPNHGMTIAGPAATTVIGAVITAVPLLTSENPTPPQLREAGRAETRGEEASAHGVTRAPASPTTAADAATAPTLGIATAPTPGIATAPWRSTDLAHPSRVLQTCLRTAQNLARLTLTERLRAQALASPGIRVGDPAVGIATTDITPGIATSDITPGIATATPIRATPSRCEVPPPVDLARSWAVITHAALTQAQLWGQTATPPPSPPGVLGHMSIIARRREAARVMIQGQSMATVAAVEVRATAAVADGFGPGGVCPPDFLSPQPALHHAPSSPLSQASLGVSSGGGGGGGRSHAAGPPLFVYPPIAAAGRFHHHRGHGMAPHPPTATTAVHPPSRLRPAPTMAPPSPRLTSGTLSSLLIPIATAPGPALRHPLRRPLFDTMSRETPSPLFISPSPAPNVATRGGRGLGADPGNPGALCRGLPWAVPTHQDDPVRIVALAPGAWAVWGRWAEEQRQGVMQAVEILARYGQWDAVCLTLDWLCDQLAAPAGPSPPTTSQQQQQVKIFPRRLILPPAPNAPPLLDETQAVLLRHFDELMAAVSLGEWNYGAAGLGSEAPLLVRLKRDGHPVYRLLVHLTQAVLCLLPPGGSPASQPAVPARGVSTTPVFTTPSSSPGTSVPPTPPEGIASSLGACPALGIATSPPTEVLDRWVGQVLMSWWLLLSLNHFYTSARLRTTTPSATAAPPAALSQALSRAHLHCAARRLSGLHPPVDPPAPPPWSPAPPPPPSPASSSSSPGLGLGPTEPPEVLNAQGERADASRLFGEELVVGDPWPAALSQVAGGRMDERVRDLVLDAAELDWTCWTCRLEVMRGPYGPVCERRWLVLDWTCRLESRHQTPANALLLPLVTFGCVRGLMGTYLPASLLATERVPPSGPLRPRPGRASSAVPVERPGRPALRLLPPDPGGYPPADLTPIPIPQYPSRGLPHRDSNPAPSHGHVDITPANSTPCASPTRTHSAQLGHGVAPVPGRTARVHPTVASPPGGAIRVSGRVGPAAPRVPEPAAGITPGRSR